MSRLKPLLLIVIIFSLLAGCRKAKEEQPKPVPLPAGTTVRVDASWDNSANNKYNPRPGVEVFWGEQSWDEMFSPTLRGVMQLKSPITPTLPLAQVSQR